MNSSDYTLKLLIEAQDKFSTELNSLQSKLESIEKQTKKTSDTANNMLSWIKSWIAKLWLTALITKTTSSIVDLADKLEQSKIAFETMLWSWERAEQMLQQLSDFAVKTPFEIQWVRQNAQQLIAMWVSADDILPTLKSLWDVSAWLSVPLERLALNYWQVIAQWKLTGRELRDFTMAWVPLLDELSQMLWKSTTEIQNMISAWQISSNDVVQAFQNMTSEWWRFADLMSKQATTLSWLRSNFKDNLSRIGEEVWTDLLPTLKWYVEQFNGRVEEHKDTVVQVIHDIFDTAKSMFDNLVSSVSEVWWVVQNVLNDLQTSFNYLFGAISSSDEETTTWIKWDWSDVFYYIQLWFSVVVNTIKLAITTIYAYLKAYWKSVWDVIWMMWRMFSALRTDVKNWAINMAENWVNAVVDMINWMIDKINRLSNEITELTWLSMWLLDTVNKVDFWWWETWNLSREISTLSSMLKDNFTEMSDTISSSFESSMNNVLDVYWNRVEKVLNETKQKFNDTTKDIKQSLSTITNDDDTTSWWSWSKKESEAMKKLKKEMDDYAKETKKMVKDKYQALDKEAEIRLNNQKKNIDELNKSFEEWFDKIQDNIDDTKSKIDSLNKEISNLQENLAKTKVDENKSIAKEVVQARKELKALEDQYEWLKEVADSVSLADLEWKWWVWKFDTDLIKKYKWYQDELNSMYDWMSAEEQKALDKEIEYATRYDSLNWIEKIKEDYRIRKEEIQSELNEKISSLNSEQALLRQYKKEQQKLQDERIKRIDEEVKKRQDVAEKKKKFEKEYMDVLEINQKRQVEMTNQLISQWNAVYQAKKRAMEYSWDWSRASWWPVYAWNSYLVWETWPELFVPSTNWKIVNNSDLSNASSPVNITIDMWWVVLNNWLDEEELLDRMESRLTRSLQLYKKWITL